MFLIDIIIKFPMYTIYTKDSIADNMITTFHSEEKSLKFSIENYDLRKTNARYKAVINDAQLAVLHLQSIDTEDTQPDVSQLSLCPGVLESEVLPLLFQSSYIS